MQTLRDLIITSFNFSNIDDEEKNKMIEDLSNIAMQRTVIRTLEKMGESEVAEFEKIMADTDDTSKVFSYLETQVPSFYDMLQEEVMRLVDLAAEENK